MSAAVPRQEVWHSDRNFVCLDYLERQDDYDVNYLGRVTVSAGLSGTPHRGGSALPHVVIEYSANLAGQLNVPALMQVLRDSALATGIFPLGGMRVRAYRAEDYLVADGHPANAFVHIVMRIGHGRDLETRKRAGDAIFTAACASLASLYDRTPLGISFEMQEIEPVLAFRKNNLHEYVKSRQVQGGAAPMKP